MSTSDPGRRRRSTPPCATAGRCSAVRPWVRSITGPPELTEAGTAESSPSWPAPRASIPICERTSPFSSSTLQNMATTSPINRNFGRTRRRWWAVAAVSSVPHQPERHRDAPPVRADEDVRSVASEAPVRAFDDDVTTFGAVVTAVLGAIFGATFGAALGAAVLRAAAALAAPAAVRCGCGHGRGLRAAPAPRALPAGGPRSPTRTPPSATRRWADRATARPRCRSC